MGITERREREKEQRRINIIEAAERVFFSKGYGSATMDDVAAEAELSKGTLYLYFKNKVELYLAINLRGFNILTQKFQDAISKPVRGIDKVREIGRAYYQFYKEYPDYYNALMYWESHEMKILDKDSEAGKCVNEGHRALDVVVEALYSGMNDGSIRADLDPSKTAVILWGHCSGLIQLLSLKGEHFKQEHGLNPDELIEYSFELIKRSLKK